MNQIFNTLKAIFNTKFIKPPQILALIIVPAYFYHYYAISASLNQVTGNQESMMQKLRQMMKSGQESKLNIDKIIIQQNEKMPQRECEKYSNIEECSQILIEYFQIQKKIIGLVQRIQINNLNNNEESEQSLKRQYGDIESQENFVRFIFGGMNKKRKIRLYSDYIQKQRLTIKVINEEIKQIQQMIDNKNNKCKYEIEYLRSRLKDYKKIYNQKLFQKIQQGIDNQLKEVDQ